MKKIVSVPKMETGVIRSTGTINIHNNFGDHRWFISEIGVLLKKI